MYSPASQNAKRCRYLGSIGLEQTVDLARLGVDVDVQIARSGRQARDSLDVSSKGITWASCQHIIAHCKRGSRLTGTQRQLPF